MRVFRSLSRGHRRRRDEVQSGESSTDAAASDQAARLETFQTQVTERFTELSLVGDEEILSLGWLGKLLDDFIFCQEEFRAIIHNYESQFSKRPMDRMIMDYFDRSVKAVDFCTGLRNGIDQINYWKQQIEIVMSAFDAGKRPYYIANFRRAKKPLTILANEVLDEKEPSTPTLSLSPRNFSFGRSKKDTASSSSSSPRTTGKSGSFSWKGSSSWSAAKQLKALDKDLSAPRAGDVKTTNGLAVTVYTMNSILLFVIWTLVAAIPCQDRGLKIQFSPASQFNWAAPITSLYERILEESKKKDRKKSCGLLREIHQIEISSKLLTQFADSVQDQLPLIAAKEPVLRNRVDDLVRVHDVLQERLDPFAKKIRDVKQRFLETRTEELIHTNVETPPTQR